MQRFVSHSVQDTEKIAAKLAERLKGGEVIAFTGPMGICLLYTSPSPRD